MILSHLVQHLLLFLLISAWLDDYFARKVLKVCCFTIPLTFFLPALKIRNLLNLDRIVMVVILTRARGRHEHPAFGNWLLTSFMRLVSRGSAPRLTMALRLCKFDTWVVVARTEWLCKERIPSTVTRLIQYITFLSMLFLVLFVRLWALALYYPLGRV